MKLEPKMEGRHPHKGSLQENKFCRVHKGDHIFDKVKLKWKWSSMADIVCECGKIGGYVTKGVNKYKKGVFLSDDEYYKMYDDLMS